MAHRQPGGDPALIVVAHGSQRESWQSVVAGAQAGWEDVFGAGLRMCFVGGRPEAFRETVESAYQAGARRIVILPLFVGPGGHVTDDIDGALTEFSQTHQDCEVERLGTLLEIPLVVEAITRQLKGQLTPD